MSARPTWLVPVVVLALAFAASAGIAARGYYQSDDEPARAEPVVQRGGWDDPPKDTRVRLSADALTHPDHEQVRGLLQNYFDAINAKDYAAWTRTVVQEFVAEKPESQFQADFASTQDSDAYVYRIVANGEGSLQVLFRFASRQRPDDAPLGLHRGCLWWRAAYGLTKTDGGWLVDDDNLNAQSQPC